MSRFRYYATNVLTAVVTCLVTSLFWILAYSGDSSGPPQNAANRSGASAPVPQADLIKGPTGLAIPVVGVTGADLVDTFTEARAGGARIHDAIDIMAKAGTPVIAAAPGRLERLFLSEGGGGISAYVRSRDGRWSYYYAHLQDYAPGLREGQTLRQGDRIGTVGSTGNANQAAPHLHFAIHRMAPGDKWYDGTAINPYPLLAGSTPDR